MQAYFEPEQAFSITMPQPVCEISIAYKKKHVVIFRVRNNGGTWDMSDKFIITSDRKATSFA